MEVQNLNVAYRKNHVLHDLNVNFIDSAINGLVGMNGAGKTTLLRAIFGSKKVDSGSINWNGESIRPSQVGFLETENFFYPKMKGIEYLEIFRLSNPGFVPEHWNELFELPLNKLVDEYSTGMKKKLALMGVIGLDKPILMLDEPFNGVDLESNEKIKLVIMKLKERGKTVIVTSHILETLTSICDQISILAKGQVVRTALKDEFEEVRQFLYTSITDSVQHKIDKIFDGQ